MSNQLRLDVAQLTDVGRKRPHNEDHMAHVIPKDPQTLSRKGALFVVADGMGGHAAGEIASEIAVETVSVVYYQDDSDDVSTSLIHAIKRANTLIHQRAAENMLRSGMGTTCIAAVLRGSTAYITNVGDSRLYLVRGNMVQQISQDHSWVAEQVRAKLLTEEQARSHAQRNVITRCLGTQSDVDVDLFIQPLEVGDALVLCSDGLSGLLDEEELCTIVNQYVPQESVYHLIERANEHGGPDNITAIVVRVQEVGWEPVPVLKGGQNGYGERSADAISAVQTVGLPVHAEQRHVSAPLYASSGPLYNEGSVPVAMKKPRVKRRMLYPSLIITLLLLVALVGGGIFYLFRQTTLDIDSMLSNAQTMIDRANTQLANNQPTLALQYLATAQQELRTVQGNPSLTDTQRKQLTTLLNSDLIPSLKQAISHYNGQNAIITPPCLSVTPATISTGSTGAQASSIVALEDAKTSKVSLYVLGDNHTLYQLSSNASLISLQLKWPSSQTQILTVASDGSRLLALTTVPAQANTGATYGLSVLAVGNGGLLNVVNSVPMHFSSSNTASHVPMLLTAWGSDVYVASTSTADQMTTITHYMLDGNNKLSDNPNNATVSTSTPLVSLAAFPNKQLFFLFKDGSIANMLFVGGSQTSSSVVVKKPVAQPLAIQTDNFTVATPIPTAVTQQSPFLAIPNATLLVAGSVNSVSHLYIVDSVNYRILDLESVPMSSTPTPTKTSGTVVAGAASVVMLQLDAQYASPDQLPNVKSIATDPGPKAQQIYVLTQKNISDKTTNILSLAPNQESVCMS